PPQLMRGIQTGLMPAMDEGAFVLDYWAPSGTPLSETEKLAQKIEEILSNNPDVDSYVLRTGAELGIFATQTFGGDFQVVLRPAEDKFFKRLTKPMRPKMDDPFETGKFEDARKRWGKEAARKKYGAKFEQVDDEARERMVTEEGNAIVRQKY